MQFGTQAIWRMAHLGTKMDRFIPNRKNMAIRTLYKPISKNFAPNTRDEILTFFYKVWPWNKLKSLDVFSVIRLKGELRVFIGKILQVLYSRSILVIKT